MRVSDLLAAAVLLLAVTATAAAAQVDPGDTFRRLDRGRTITTALPADTGGLVIYYGASWCGPCRAFVPELIAAYPALRRRGMEVLFVSDDGSCATALDYARASRMPWLLLPCDPARRSRLRALGGKALPGMVVLDRAGHVQRTSWDEAGDSSPRRLLAALLADNR